MLYFKPELEPLVDRLELETPDNLYIEFIHRLHTDHSFTEDEAEAYLKIGANLNFVPVVPSYHYDAHTFPSILMLSNRYEIINSIFKIIPLDIKKKLLGYINDQLFTNNFNERNVLNILDQFEIHHPDIFTPDGSLRDFWSTEKFITLLAYAHFNKHSTLENRLLGYIQNIQKGIYNRIQLSSLLNIFPDDDFLILLLEICNVNNIKTSRYYLDQNTAILNILKRNKRIDILKIFMGSAYIDPDIKNNNTFMMGSVESDDTMMHLFVKYKYIELIDIFLSAGFNPTLRNNNGYTCWDIADDDIKVIFPSLNPEYY